MSLIDPPSSLPAPLMSASGKRTASRWRRRERFVQIGDPLGPSLDGESWLMVERAASTTPVTLSRARVGSAVQSATSPAMRRATPTWRRSRCPTDDDAAPITLDPRSPPRPSMRPFAPPVDPPAVSSRVDSFARPGPPIAANSVAMIASRSTSGGSRTSGRRSMYSSESFTRPRPSLSVWCKRMKSAPRPPSTPSMTTNVHNGRVRSNGSSWRREARSYSWASDPGAGSAM